MSGFFPFLKSILSICCDFLFNVVVFDFGSFSFSLGFFCVFSLLVVVCISGFFGFIHYFLGG